MRSQTSPWRMCTGSTITATWLQPIRINAELNRRPCVFIILFSVKPYPEWTVNPKSRTASVSRLTLKCSARCILILWYWKQVSVTTFFIVACFPSLERLHFCLDTVKRTEVKSMWHKIMFLDLAMVPVLFFVYFWGSCVCVSDDWSSSTGWCR